MGEYIKNKKEMNFSSMDSLKPVQKVINEAAAALNDKNRTIANSAIPEVLAGAVDAGAGGAIGFAALYLGGPIVGLNAAGIAGGLAAAGALVGGGMAAGIGTSRPACSRWCGSCITCQESKIERSKRVVL